MHSVRAGPSLDRCGHQGQIAYLSYSCKVTGPWVAWGERALHTPTSFVRSRSRCEGSGCQPRPQLAPPGRWEVRQCPIHLQSDSIPLLWWGSGSPHELPKHVVPRSLEGGQDQGCDVTKFSQGDSDNHQNLRTSGLGRGSESHFLKLWMFYCTAKVMGSPVSRCSRCREWQRTEKQREASMSL